MPGTKLFEGMEYVGGYPVYPVASIFPMMGDSELQELADDIAENGQLEVIELAYLDEGATIEVLIDGRNRFRACEIAGVSPIIQVNHGLYPDQISPYIISKNLHRRNLDKGQLAFLAAEALAVESEFAKARMSAGGKGGLNKVEGVEDSPHLKAKGKARDIVAERFGVSGRSVSDAATVKKHNPALAEAGKRGEVAPSTAARQIRQKIREEETKDNPPALPPREQEKLDSHLKIAVEKAHEAVHSLSAIDHSKSTPEAKARAMRELELTRDKITRMLRDMRSS